MSETPAEDVITVLTADNDWALFDFKELTRYRDLFYFLVWRDIKVLYAQTVLGFAWAILNPAVQIVVFSIIFGIFIVFSKVLSPSVLNASNVPIPSTSINSGSERASLTTILLLDTKRAGRRYS